MLRDLTENCILRTIFHEKFILRSISHEKLFTNHYKLFLFQVILTMAVLVPLICNFSVGKPVTTIAVTARKQTEESCKFNILQIFMLPKLLQNCDFYLGIQKTKLVEEVNGQYK